MKISSSWGAGPSHSLFLKSAQLKKKQEWKTSMGALLPLENQPIHLTKVFVTYSERKQRRHSYNQASIIFWLDSLKQFQKYPVNCRLMTFWNHLEPVSRKLPLNAQSEHEPLETHADSSNFVPSMQPGRRNSPSGRTRSMLKKAVEILDF